MSEPIKPVIISLPLTKLLSAMRLMHGPATTKQLEQVMNLCHTIVFRRLAELMAMGMVAAVPPAPRAKGQNGRAGGRHAITRAGRRALLRHQSSDEKAESVPSQKINLFTLPVLVPERCLYYRNDGNKHISSRGFSC